MTTNTGIRYTVELRDRSGHVLAEGSGGEDWQQTLVRIASKAGYCRRTAVVHAQYYPTAAGYPVGTHHVQFGFYVGEAGARQLSLGNQYVASVQAEA